MPVADLLARTSSRELAEWMAYEKLTGPLGPVRADLNAALIASIVANSQGAKTSPKDFMPDWDRQPVTPEDLLAKVVGINAALGGATRKG